MFGTNNRHKLVTTHADCSPDAVKRVLEHIGKGAQKLIAHGMPKVVVYVLKSIHVDTHNRVVTIIAVEHFKNAFALGAVVNARQSIAISNLAEHFFLSLVHEFLVHVDEIAHHQEQDEQERPHWKASRIQEGFFQAEQILHIVAEQIGNAKQYKHHRSRSKNLFLHSGTTIVKHLENDHEQERYKDIAMVNEQECRVMRNIGHMQNSRHQEEQHTKADNDFQHVQLPGRNLARTHIDNQKAKRDCRKVKRNVFQRRIQRIVRGNNLDTLRVIQRPKSHQTSKQANQNKAVISPVKADGTAACNKGNHPEKH